MKKKGVAEKQRLFLMEKGENMYTTKQGQAWDQIAREVYGNEIYADFLMENNQRYLNILIFPAGIELNTPKLPEQKKDLPPWR